MTKKKKIVLSAVAVMTFALAVLLFGLRRSEPVLTMPISPDKVSDVGRYYLDDTRFIEIKKSTDGLEYWEGHQQPNDTHSPSPLVVSYSASEIKSVQLDMGWSIEFDRPDQLQITLGKGDSHPTNTTITRRRSTE